MLTPDNNGQPKINTDEVMATVYRSTQQMLAASSDIVLISLDFSNLEKKHSQKLEGICQVHGKDGIINGYPMLTAIAATEGKRGIIYNKLFSYDIDFNSENTEINLAVDQVRSTLAGHKIRWVADRGFDDIKKIQKFEAEGNEFVVRIYHDRKVQVAGQEIKLFKLAQQLPLVGELKSELMIQKRKRIVKIVLYAGNFELEGKTYWLEKAVVEGHTLEWLLITNVDLSQAEKARSIWVSYRQRWGIEDFFNFSKETFKLEKFMLRSFEGIRLMVALLMVALSFIHQEFYYDDNEPMAIWILTLGGWCGPKWPKGKKVFSWGIERLLTYYAISDWLAKNKIDPEKLRRWFGPSEMWDHSRPNQQKKRKYDFGLG